MAKVEAWYEQDLKRPVRINYLDGSFFNQDAAGSRIGVKVYSDGQAVTLAGSITGYCVRADGTTVPISGTRSGNTAYIDIPQSALSVPGPLTVTIKNTESSVITTLCAVVGIVTQSRTGVQVDPGQTVTDWTNQISAQLQACQDAADNVGAIVAVPYANLTFPVEVDTYTTYNGNLYCCITRIETSESFTAAHWRQTNVCREISDLKSAITTNSNAALPNPFYLFTSLSYIDLDVEVGSLVSLTPKADLNYCHTIIDCNDGDVFWINVRGHNSKHSAYAWLDAEDKMLYHVYSTFANEKITAPTNAKKLVLNNNTASIPNPWCYKNELIYDKVDRLEGSTVINYGTLVSGSYVEHETGKIVNNANYSRTDFIPVLSEKIWQNRTFNSEAGIAFFDANLNYISGINNGYAPYTGTERVSDVPSNAFYMMVSVLSGYTLSLKTAGNPKNQINNIINKISGKYTYPLTANDVFVSQYIHKDTGFPYAYSYSVRTKPIPTGKYGFVSLNCYIGYDIAFAFYDKHKNVLQVIKSSDLPSLGYGVTEQYRYTFVIPEKACYLIACMRTSDYVDYNSFNICFFGEGRYESSQEREITEIAEPYERMIGKVLCIGDSLTEGHYDSHHVPTYPEFFADITGLDVTNEGRSGYTAKQWWDEVGANYDFSGFDAYIIWLGTNGGLTDTLATDVTAYESYTDYADTNTGNYCKIISKIIAQNSNAKIYLGSIYYGGTNVGITNKVIYEIAELERYEDNIIGVCNNDDDELKKNIENPSARDLAMHPYDGLHFGRVGNLYVAYHYVRRIRELINDNMGFYAR